jgi:hypothetical protein
MKKLFLAVTITLLTPCTGTLYAADTPQPDMEQILLKYGNKAEEESKKELKELVQDKELKKNLEAARKDQKDTEAASTDTQKTEEASTTN